MLLKWCVKFNHRLIVNFLQSMIVKKFKRCSIFDEFSTKKSLQRRFFSARGRVKLLPRRVAWRAIWGLFQVIIHEALMLLQETYRPAVAAVTADVDQQRDADVRVSSSCSSEVVQRFISAVSNSKLIAKPFYIRTASDVSSAQHSVKCRCTGGIVDESCVWLIF